MKTWLTLVIALAAVRAGRAEEVMNKCIQLAMPLLSETHLVVPSTREELRTVCEKWRVFVDCINNYVSKKYTSEQKDAFNGAVETAVRNVFRMCQEPQYSEAYLRHAPCIKQMTMEPSRCGTYYTNMARAVTDGTGSDEQICCLHRKFRDCMAEQGSCDSSPRDSSVQEFVREFLDNGLHVFDEKCHNYVFSPRHCAGPRQTRVDDYGRRPEPQPQPEPQPEPELRPEHRATEEQERRWPRPGPTAAPAARPGATTTPYQSWFHPDTTTSVWLANNAIDDLAQAQRQESAAGGAAAAALTLAAGLLAALAAR
ncbi:uncharacterized protein LOC122386482 [Amphibalanus amphitrite]|uniref:uncharacterized protein LOC122386482 n=1 Tax=Amphibalanus amphitrite TaxID=1232801 RepID=UPI001C911310|nr:uncharacterized protein LOC122386482 [Amphibalanus amphitrite]